MDLSAAGPGSEQTEEPFPRQSRGRRFVRPLPLLIARLGIADRQQGVVVLEPDPVPDRGGLHQIPTGQPEAKLRGSPQQDGHHFLPVRTGGEGLIGFLRSIKRFHKQGDALTERECPGVHDATCSKQED